MKDKALKIVLNIQNLQHSLKLRENLEFVDFNVQILEDNFLYFLFIKADVTMMHSLI